MNWKDATTYTRQQPGKKRPVVVGTVGKQGFRRPVDFKLQTA